MHAGCTEFVRQLLGVLRAENRRSDARFDQHPGEGDASWGFAEVTRNRGERLEYTLVGDTVNLAQRLQDLARPAGNTVASDATVRGAEPSWDWESLGECDVKGRQKPVLAYRLATPIKPTEGQL